MLKINGSDIYITRGDTAEIDVEISRSDGTAYTLASTDKLTLTVKKSISAEKEVISKTLTGSSRIKIAPTDTSGLAFGEYVYDIQLNTADGGIYTIVEPSKLIIATEVTV